MLLPIVGGRHFHTAAPGTTSDHTDTSRLQNIHVCLRVCTQTNAPTVIQQQHVSVYNTLTRELFSTILVLNFILTVLTGSRARVSLYVTSQEEQAKDDQMQGHHLHRGRTQRK